MTSVAEGGKRRASVHSPPPEAPTLHYPPLEVPTQPAYQSNILHQRFRASAAMAFKKHCETRKKGIF